MAVSVRRRWMAGVGALTVGMGVLSAVALAPSASAATCTVAAAGDIASGSGNQVKTAAVVQQINPVAVLTLGDNAYPDGTTKNFTDYYDPSWGKFKAITKPAPGNHEYHTAGGAGYFAYFGVPKYYSFELCGWHVMSLNQELTGAERTTEVAWLKADLAANAGKPMLAYWHEPRWTSGSRHGSDTGAQDLWAAVATAGVRVVLTGHEHLYERLAEMDSAGKVKPGGTREFVVGEGGASLYSFGTPLSASEKRVAGEHGVLALNLRPDGYDWKLHQVGGSVADSGSQSFGGTTGTTAPTATTATTVKPTSTTAKPTSTTVKVTSTTVKPTSTTATTEMTLPTETTLPTVTTLPSTTIPPSTIPVTTIPGTTSSTMPPSTMPSTTLPSTTLPSTTLPHGSPSTTVASSTSTTVSGVPVKTRGKKSFKPVADSFVKQDDPSGALASLKYLAVGNRSGADVGSAERRAYITFDVSGTGTSTPTKATLKLRTYSKIKSPVSVVLVANPATGGSATDGKVIATIPKTKKGKNINVDVSSAISGDGTYTFMLVAKDSTSLSRFYSSESKHSPKLKISLSGRKN